MPRRSNFDRYSYRIVEEHRGEPIPPGMLDRYSVVARVQGESQQEADARARLIAAAPETRAALRESLAWVAKVAADADEGDPTGIAARALRFHAKVTALLEV